MIHLHFQRVCAKVPNGHARGKPAANKRARAGKTNEPWRQPCTKETTQPQAKMHTYSRQSPPRQLSELPRFPEIEGKGSLEAGATDAPTLDQALVQEVVINPKGPSRAARLHTVCRRPALAMPPLQRVAAAKAHHLKSTVRRTARAGMQRKRLASVLQSFARSGEDHSRLLLPQLL